MVQAGRAYPFQGRSKPLVAGDWSHAGVDITFNGDDVSRVANLDALLDSLIEPHEIVIESAFENFEQARRHEFINRCAREGHTLLTLNPRATELWRRTNGRVEKSNENDARTIFAIVREGVSFLKIPVCRCDDCADPEFREFSERHKALRIELMKRRYTKTYGEVLDRATSYLGDPRELPDNVRLVLSDGRHWRPPLMVTVILTSEVARSRDEFERFLGLYSHGYPSIMRSNVYYWGLGSHYNRVGKERGLDPDVFHNDPRSMKDARAQFRRSLRWAFHHIRAGIAEPSQGSPEPAPSLVADGQTSTPAGQDKTRGNE